MALLEYGIKKDFFSFDGRVGRWTYFIRGIALTVASSLVTVVCTLAFGGSGGALAPLAALIKGLMSIATYISGLSLVTRRLHDMNRSGWWQLIFVLPCIGVFAGVILMGVGLAAKAVEIPNQVAATLGLSGVVVLLLALLIILIFQLLILFKKGTTGSNDYGEDPLA